MTHTEIIQAKIDACEKEIVTFIKVGDADKAIWLNGYKHALITLTLPLAEKADKLDGEK